MLTKGVCVCVCVSGLIMNICSSLRLQNQFKRVQCDPLTGPERDTRHAVAYLHKAIYTPAHHTHSKLSSGSVMMNLMCVCVYGFICHCRSQCQCRSYWFECKSNQLVGLNWLVLGSPDVCLHTMYLCIHFVEFHCSQINNITEYYVSFKTGQRDISHLNIFNKIFYLQFLPDKMFQIMTYLEKYILL